ncbi:MAG TPA: hypothetical protein VL970_02495, partial [Candidatus Acidoferrales bacterium]|nr:hypothetical protein [Candidatus Acidoferrales bacterium]
MIKKTIITVLASASALLAGCNNQPSAETTADTNSAGYSASNGWQNAKESGSNAWEATKEGATNAF